MSKELCELTIGIKRMSYSATDIDAVTNLAVVQPLAGPSLHHPEAAAPRGPAPRGALPRQGVRQRAHGPLRPPRRPHDRGGGLGAGLCATRTPRAQAGHEDHGPHPGAANGSRLLVRGLVKF